MRIAKVLVAAAVLSMSAAPALAAVQTNPAASLSLAGVSRASSPSTHGNEAFKKGYVVAFLAVVAVVVGIVILADHHHDKSDSN